MGEFEAVGEVLTGGLIGRAVEPSHGEGHGAQDGHGVCLNCGTALIGEHCHHCGQAGHVHRSLSAIGHEILHGVVHFEGKLWKTLPLLLWRPGELTRRYARGERARFVSPMALFLFSIFTMFAVFQIMGIAPPAEINTGTQVEAGIEKGITLSRTARAEAVKKRDALPANDPERAKLDQRIASLDADLNALSHTRPFVGIKAGKDLSVNTGWERLDHGIEKWKTNPGLMLYKLQSNSYKFSWLLIPLSLPFMWMLFFYKRGYHLYDHMVFVTYSIAFMSLLFIAITIAGGLGVGSVWLATAATTIPVWHLYRQLQGAYRLGRVSAVVRTTALIVCIFIVLTLFLVALVMLGMVG